VYQARQFVLSSDQMHPDSGKQPRRGSPCEPLPWPPPRRLPPAREPRRRPSGLSQKPATDARGTISRSIWTSRTRASRARWSSSTLGTLLFQIFILAMASSIARVPRE